MKVIDTTSESYIKEKSNVIFAEILLEKSKVISEIA